MSITQNNSAPKGAHPTPPSTNTADRLNALVESKLADLDTQLKVAESFRELYKATQGGDSKETLDLENNIKSRMARLEKGLHASIARVATSDERVPLSIAAADPSERPLLIAEREAILKTFRSIMMPRVDRVSPHDAYHSPNLVASWMGQGDMSMVENKSDLEHFESLLKEIKLDQPPSEVEPGSTGRQRKSPSEVRVPRDLTEAGQLLIACALAETRLNNGEFDLVSPIVVTRAVLSFGGDFQHYHDVLTYLKREDVNIMPLQEGARRINYRLSADLAQGFDRIAGLSAEEVKDACPSLGRILELSRAVDSRPVHAIIHDPSPAQVRNVERALAIQLNKNSGVARLCVDLLEIRTDSNFNKPGRIDHALKNADRNETRSLLRLGIITHENNNRNDRYYITPLGETILWKASNAIFEMISRQPGCDQG